LDSRWRKRVRRAAWAKKYGRLELKALSEIGPGAAARVISAGRPVAAFFEQVEYNGRRLAKLNVLPVEVMQSLREYENVLNALLRDRHDLRPVREQLNLCVLLTLNNSYYQVREAETEAFYGLFRAEVDARNLDDLLARCVAILTCAFRAQAGRMLLLDRQSGMTRERKQKLSRARYILAGSPNELLIDSSLRGRFHSYWSMPLRARKRTIGVAQFGFHTAYAWLPRELQLFNAAAERCLAAVERAQLVHDLDTGREQIRRLAGRVMQVEEQERRRIRRELHDEPGQSMLFLRLRLEMLEKEARQKCPSLVGRLAEAREVTERAVTEIRRAIADLSPAALEQLGLPAAVRQLGKQFRKLHPASVALRIQIGPGRLPKAVECSVYRLIQECFHNIARHSRANHIKVTLRCADKWLRLSVEDNGIGFDTAAVAGKRDSYGLAGMRERVTLLGGRFLVRSRPGRGVAIAIELPIVEEPHAGLELTENV
jgi:signal transduction histidine kinase